MCTADAPAHIIDPGSLLFIIYIVKWRLCPVVVVVN